MRTIFVNQMTNMALTESDGLKLRRVIENSLADSDCVELDFSGISLFATMFFNASIGHLVMSLSPEKCADIIRISNISDLGNETYRHSFENAKAIFAQYGSLKKIGEITKTNLDNS